MVCASCGRVAKAGARFCAGCGTSLAPRCPGCGAETEPDAHFCGACGASLSARPKDAGVSRKVVTIVFADLIGSTALHERLDPESVSRIMEAYHGAVRAPIEAHGGTVVQLLGDGVMCAFGVPRVAEDDALRAVRAAVDVQRSFREFLRERTELAERIGLRVAVNTGEVVVSDDYAAGIGDPLNVAGTLQHEAKDGDVLIGEATQRLVAAQVTLARVGSFALKGRAEPVTAYRVVSLDRPAGAAATPFVGRDEELRRITAVYDAAIAAPAARLAVLLGSPGLGKSRLLAEFGRRLGERASVITAQCNASGGATFAPLAEALRAHLQLAAGVAGEALRAAIDAAVPGDEAERARIAKGVGALLAGTPAAPEETFFVVRRLLAALAAEQPLVLVIDDLQWAEPLLLDFTEHLVQWGTGVPLLVLAAARPELRDARSSLTTPGGLVSDVVTLTGLDAGAAMRLAANVIGADTLPAAVAGRVLTASEGNPLFVGELVRMLVNDGALRKEGERWTLAVDLAELEMPPTIQALLAARIERLRPEERLVLERAAVVGRQFSRAAVTHLLPREAHADLDVRLEALRRSELIEADTGWLLGEPTLRFHHLLIRDAAYRRVLRGTRAELHGRFAEWLEARVGESVEYDETIGWHLEQAHQHLRELGALDANGRALGERASRHLALAGRRALARDDLGPAASLLGRALACLGDADPARADLTLDHCEALLAAGDVGPAARAVAEFGRFAAGSERLRAWHTCFSGQLAALADPKALRSSAEAVAAAAETLAAAGDVAGEAKAHAVHADALARLGMIGPCEAALDKALTAARRAPNRRLQNAVLAGAPVAALWGPSPVTRASGRCLDVVRVLRITQGAPAVEAVALRCQAVLETLRGRSEAARRMIASSRRLVEELGITQRLLEVDASAGLIELLEGDARAAEGWLRAAYEGFRAHGLGVDAAQAAALLGRALLAQGRAAEAEAASRESEALAGDDFKAAIAWRGVRAEALAGRGEHAAAVELARAAVEIAAATDDLLDHADARSALAVALRSEGRSDEAGAEEARAIALWEQKGATLLAERARSRIARVAQPERAPDTRVERPSARRRVRPNAATANVARLNAAVEARDADALLALQSEGLRVVHHPAGAVLNRQELLAWLRLLFTEDRDFVFREEPLATLGDSLLLCRESWAGTESGDGAFEVGRFERSGFLVGEVDAQGRAERGEYFGPDRLGDAIIRLYERHAELLSDGPERARATATARSVAAILLESPGPDRWASAFSPTIEFVDDRVVGPGTLRGADAVGRSIRALFELQENWVYRIDDVLGLQSDALLLRWNHSGTERAGGGAFERDLCELFVFGADGLVARWEQSDAERSAEALARFDALTAGPTPARAVRRKSVRPNAATANAARVEAAVLERWDADALETLLAEDAASVDHKTGAEFDRPQMLRAWRSFLTAEGFQFAAEPLATLGESLALCRNLSSARGVARGDFDVGPYDREEIVLIEVDTEGRRRRHEVFAPERLGDAIVRLYERYAELLSDGPERARAAAMARSIAALTLSLDVDRWARAISPDVVAVDHRPLGLPPLHGAEAFLGGLRSLLDLVDDSVARVDDVLGLRPEGLVVRWTNLGTQRASGGAYERNLLALRIFGADGLLTRYEMFAAEDVERALARFDELKGGGQESPFENAASRGVRSLERCWHARDWEGVVGTFGAGYRLSDRRSLIGLDVEGAEALASVRMSFGVESGRWSSDLLATRGERLALFRRRFRAEGIGDVGAFETGERLSLVETDADGRRVLQVHFDLDDLDAAYAELDARYVAGEGAPHARSLASIQRFETALAARDWAELTRVIAPDLAWRDHRLVGLHAEGSRDEYLASLRAWFELAPDTRERVDHVLAQDDRHGLAVVRWVGSREGGPFEIQFLVVTLLDSAGRIRQFDTYELDQLDAARARFDALAAAPPAPWLENAATRASHEVDAAWASRDWERFAAAHPPGFRRIDRRSMVRLDLTREEHLELARPLFEMEFSRFGWEALATRGDRLALGRWRFEGSDRDVGPSVIEFVDVSQVDARGDRIEYVLFDPDDLDAAYAELDERYGATSMPIPFLRALAARDWDAVAALLAPDLVHEDHRLLGGETLRGPAAYLAFLQALVDLAPGARPRADHIEVSGRGGLAIATVRGTWEGGSFEWAIVIVAELDAQKRILRVDAYGLEQLEEARARLRALAASAPRDPLAALVPPNAASAAMDRVQAAFEARDWAAVRALAAEGARFEDRRRHALDSGDVDWLVANLKLEVQDSGLGHFQRKLVATFGDRLCLEHSLWSGGPDEGRYEIEYLWLAEVDASGRLIAGVLFDVDDRRAAIRDAHARWLAGDAAAAAVGRPLMEFLEGVNDRDRARIRAVLADDLASQDRRRTGEGRVDGADAYLDTLAVLWNLSPDQQLEPRFVLALERHGLVSVARVFGTVAEGGAWENWLACVATVASSRITQLELFEIEQRDAALARLAELRPDPTPGRS